eukprot:scaffold932_cov207-Alexandrium_tamarense.AAC.31
MDDIPAVCNVKVQSQTATQDENPDAAAPPSGVAASSSSPLPTPETNSSGPQRYIYTQTDMEHFKHSSARKELLSFVSAMGKGLTSKENTVDNQTSSSTPSTSPFSTTTPHCYNPNQPLQHLSPALASLHGSLTCMSTTWMDGNHSDGLPPDRKVKARFGNPVFRTWHERLVNRSYGIVNCLMDCRVSYNNVCVGESGNTGGDGTSKEYILKECFEKGYEAASSEGSSKLQAINNINTSPKEEEIIAELRAYLHDSFGHPIRIDYGTGHESSFIVFLLSLCKIGCFSWGSSTSADSGGIAQSKCSPSPQSISLASLSLFHAYLNVTRGLQRDYMLEPAGSHGVWGLDDYHCVPFYLGACQMMAREQWQQERQKQTQKKKQQLKVEKEESEGDLIPTNPYLPDAALPSSTTPMPLDTHNDILEHWNPSIIHTKQTLEAHRQTYLYFSCIHFIQKIKPNVPFFESSPMLNDISSIGSWSKVASGLLRLYEGEVLDKMPVVQHFVFGKIFAANWTPSRKAPLEAPKWTFINGPGGDECIAPWAISGNNAVRVGGAVGSAGLQRQRSSSNGSSASGDPRGMAPTRAPWAT